MVGAGHPQGCVALHPLEADEDVLHGLIQGMAHVQLAGDVRRRHHDGVGLLAAVHFGVEVTALLPEVVDSVLDLGRIILFGQFFHWLGPPV